MNLSNKVLLSSVLILPLTLALESHANNTEANAKKGYDIAQRADQSDLGFSNSTTDMTMVLNTSNGKSSTRTMHQKTLEVADPDLGDKSLIVFDTPADVDGTALLSHAKILEADDQWLYLPALKRVKRISSKNKSGPFVGSEFAFEDFTALELNKFTYQYIDEENCPGIEGQLTCDVIERTPRYEHSGYTKQISWIDQSDFQVRQVEFYDRRGDLLKTLSLEDYRRYDGKYWRTHEMTMVNHKTGKSTILSYSDYQFGGDVNERDFEKNILKRIR